MLDPNSANVSRRRAIFAFTLGALFFAYAFVQRVSPSVMTSELMRDFAVGGTALGSLSAFYFYAYASIQLPVGMLTDYFGPRKLMSFAAALCALASIGFALSDSLVTASIGRALIGGTVAFAFVGSLAIAGYWFKPAHYALLAGLLQTAGMAGGIFGQAPLRQLVEVVGWRHAIEVLALLALLLAVLLLLVIPARTQQQKQHRPRPRPRPLSGLKAVSLNPQTWICSLCGFCMASSMLAFGGLWGVPWLTSINSYSTTEAAAITSMLFVGWAVFSPFCGWISDRLGKRNIILSSGATIALVSLSILLYQTPEQTILLAALIFTMGAGGSAMTVCFGSIKELNDTNYSSTSLGLMNMCIVGSGAVMQPLIGWMLDQSWDGGIINGVRVYSADNYKQAFLSLWILSLVAVIASLLLRETNCQQQLRPNDPARIG